MLGQIPPILLSLNSTMATSIAATAPTAHQTLGVNSGATAWALRTPGWLDTAQTWSDAQTFTKHAAVVLTFSPSDTVNTGSFVVTHATGAGSNPVSGRNDEVWRIGYNVNAGGGAINTALASVFTSWESYFENGGYAGPEWHVTFKLANSSTSYRPFGFAADSISGYISSSLAFTDLGVRGTGGTPFWQIATTNTGSFVANWDFVAGNKFRFNANNVSMWQQINAAGNAMIDLPYINSSNLLAVPTQIQPTFAGTTTTPCYAMVNDATTGMYSGGASNIFFTCGGTERMRVNGSQLKITGISFQMTGANTFSSADNDLFFDVPSGHAINMRPNGSSQCAAFSSVGLTMSEARNFVFGTTTGTKIGTATGQKIGFWNVTPVVQQILATGAGATVDNVISLLQTIGLCKQS